MSTQATLKKETTPQLVMRDAQDGDAGLILQFIKELAEYEKLSDAVTATETEIANTFFGANPRVHALIAEQDGVPVGFAVYFYNYSTFQGKYGIYIEDVYVREDYRGAGIGKQFFQALSQKALDEDCGRVQWWVLNWNKPSIDFYHKLGATPMDEWTVFRMEGDVIARVAANNPGKQN
ncbi:MAG TPA: GNAT family N-acetyltransferase [Alphaproteobacteria bacterium]